MKYLTFSVLVLALNAGVSLAQSQGDSYPPEVVDNFVTSCTSAATDQGVEGTRARNICSCAMGGIQEEYSYDEFVTIDQQAANGQPPPEGFNQILKDCVAEYPN